uniref:Plexin A4 n=1 Tax=Sus scrofa TaxID=9823 RepID=A0A8D1HP83_PIG
MKAMPWNWTCLLSHLLMLGMGSSTLLPRQPPPLPQKRSFVTFRGEPAESFNHLVVDERTGHIYVGAVNRIYKLSSDLKVLVTHQTGPDEDNPKCYPPRIVQTCNEPLTTTNNVNKMLLIDYKENRLIACGSLYQGICKLLRLEDLFKLGEPFHKKEHYLSGVNESGSVFGVIVSYSNLDDKLFIATAVDGKPEYFPTISSRKLTKNSEADGMFAYVFHDEFVASMIKIPSDTFTVIPDFDIYYVYGFSSGNFVYFLTLQPEMVSPPGSTTKEQVYTSKLVRLCKEDTAFNSYVEVPIGCERGGVEYRLLQAAYLSKAGAVLAQTLGVRPEDDLLFTVFSKGQKRKMKSLDESALCIFILKQINDRIKERLQSCYRGEGTLDLAWLKVKDIPCSSAIRVDGPRGNALQYETVQVVEPGPVLRDMAFSKDHEQLYIMSERQVRLPKFCCTFVLQPKTGRWLRKPTGGRPQRRHVIYLAPCASFPICCLGTEAEPAETGNETLQRAKGL